MQRILDGGASATAMRSLLAEFATPDGALKPVSIWTMAATDGRLERGGLLLKAAELGVEKELDVLLEQRLAMRERTDVVIASRDVAVALGEEVARRVPRAPDPPPPLEWNRREPTELETIAAIQDTDVRTMVKGVWIAVGFLVLLPVVFFLLHACR